MKEMQEKFEQSYIAFPIKESPLFSYVKEVNPNKNFVHMTMFFLGNITDEELKRVKETLNSNWHILKKVEIQPKTYEAMGSDKKVLAVMIESTPALQNLREALEKNLPEYINGNMSFLPHITVLKRPEASPTPKNLGITTYLPTSIGVYYRPEKDTTALLFSKKI